MMPAGVVDALKVVQSGVSAYLPGVKVAPGVEPDSASRLPVVLVQEAASRYVANGNPRFGQIVTFGVTVLADTRAEARAIASQVVEAVLQVGEQGYQSGDAWVSSSDWDALPVEVRSELVAQDVVQMSGVARFRLRH